jgi:hypothetical protein
MSTDDERKERTSFGHLEVGELMSTTYMRFSGRWNIGGALREHNALEKSAFSRESNGMTYIASSDLRGALVFKEQKNKREELNEVVFGVGGKHQQRWEQGTLWAIPLNLTRHGVLAIERDSLVNFGEGHRGADLGAYFGEEEDEGSLLRQSRYQIPPLRSYKGASYTQRAADGTKFKKQENRRKKATKQQKP